MQRTELKNIMRQDRENGDVFSESRAEYYQRLQDMKPDNGPVLEHSPCIRVKKTGGLGLKSLLQDLICASAVMKTVRLGQVLP